jgi:protease-4
MPSRAAIVEKSYEIFPPTASVGFGALIGRLIGVSVAVATHVVFFAMVWNIFWFLRDGAASVAHASLWLDAALTIGFALPHSLLLWPRAKSLITRVLPKEFYGLLFCAVTSVSLLVLALNWQGSSVVIWNATGWMRAAVHGAFYASWIGMLYSMSLTGLGFQTGLSQWLHWYRGTPMKARAFEPRSFYLWLRHPVYLSFLGLVWFTPRMTLDHAVLTGLWTAYIFIGSYLKDERLAKFCGERYRRYQERVPGYPFFPGVLGRRGMATAVPSLNALKAATAILVSFLAGCVELHKPIPISATAFADVRAKVALPPTPDLDPVRPFLLPGHSTSAQCGLVAVIDVDGLLLDDPATGIGSWGENPVALFRERLDAIERNPEVRSVVLRIHSPGGSVTATDIMWRDLKAFRERTGLPVVACLMDVATGGAYYLATGANQIVAHPTTITGAIGCILNVYNLQDLMAQFNILGTPVKSGKNIDLGTPIQALDEEGRNLLETMAKEFHDRFRRTVLEARPMVDSQDADTFDGRVFTASQAQEKNLIDRIGYLDDAIEMARDMGGAPGAETMFLRRGDDPPLSQYSVQPNVPLQDKLLPLNVPGLNRSRLPSFLYLWQMDPTIETINAK